MKTLALLLLLPALAFAQPLPPGCGEIIEAARWKMVYNRQPRFSAPIVRPNRETIPDGSNIQPWYDAGRPDFFTESDVVLDDLAGATKVVYDCTTDPTQICAAHDGEPSFDKKYILFTVARGDAWYEPIDIPSHAFYAHHYELWVYEIATGKSTMVELNARMGKWAGHGRILFASNRAGTYVPYAGENLVFPNKGLHIFSAAIDMATLRVSDVFDLMPHAVQCMSPNIFPDGEIVASCWNGFGNRAYGHTPQNLVWLEAVQGNGTNHRVMQGAHSANAQPYWKTREYINTIVDPNRAGEGGAGNKVLRPIVPLSDSKYLVSNYYRSNHQGGNGLLMLCKRSKVEGFSQAVHVAGLAYPSTNPGSAQFVPDCIAATPFAQDQDAPPKFHRNGKAMGKAGDPFAVPPSVGKFGYTRCRGDCYEPTIPSQSNTTYTGGEPVSKREIHIAKTDMVVDPFDPAQTVCIAGCDLAYNAWGARYIATYQELYDQPEPAAAPPRVTGTTTTLQVVNARIGELDKLMGPDVHPWDACNTQGCAVPDYATRVTQIVITKIDPWLVPANRPGFAAETLIGKFPLEADGSVKIVLPCNMTYQLSAQDMGNVEVAKDNSLHFAVCGEAVTCHGCHMGHSEEVSKALGQTAVERFKSTNAGMKE